MEAKIKNLISAWQQAEQNSRKAKKGKDKFLKGLFQGKVETFAFCAAELKGILELGSNTVPPTAITDPAFDE